MTVKTTGAEWKRFYSDKGAWPDGAWHDDEEITICGEPWNPDNDLMNVSDGEPMTIAGGIVFMNENAADGPSLESHFKRWRKAQSTVFFSCEAPRDRADAVKAAIIAAGGKAQAL